MGDGEWWRQSAFRQQVGPRAHEPRVRISAHLLRTFDEAQARSPAEGERQLRRAAATWRESAARETAELRGTERG
eukprot:3459475-Pleurochrysis_carterae.AAC.1